MLYLDGNSLGALPAGVPQRLEAAVGGEWGRDLISGWNVHDWIGLPQRLGDRIGALIGAAPGQTLVCDSISVNLFKLLAAALELRPERTVILSTRDNFPTDLYVVQGLQRLLGESRCRLEVVAPEALADALDERVAVAMITEVDFRSGRRHDMAALTGRIHEAGALALWDLAHSAGALPVALDEVGADLAVGCGYKYLNGGPGAPAFLYVASRHQAALTQPLAGWMGHAAPFEFELDYRPAEGIGRFQAGTPSILAMAALDAALDVWDGVDMGQLRAKSASLTGLFMDCVDAAPALADLRLLTPRDDASRGSQLAYAHPDGFAMVQALIDAGVVGDFRAPDVLRFGFAPLYLSHADVFDAVSHLDEIVSSGRYREERFRARGRVT